MRRVPAFTLTVLSLSLLTACSATPAAPPSDAPAAVTSAPIATPSPTPTAVGEFGEAKRNEHGNLIKEIGQLAGTSLPEDPSVVASRFSVTGIEVNPPCTSDYVSPPVNGRFIKVSMHIETTPELAQAGAFSSLSITEFAFDAYNSDGTRVNDPAGTAYSCLTESEKLPSQIGPGETVDGAVILDVRDESGSVALKLGGPSGWEWTY